MDRVPVLAGRLPELGGDRLQGHRSRSPDPSKTQSSHPAMVASLGAVLDHCEFGEQGPRHDDGSALRDHPACLLPAPYLHRPLYRAQVLVPEPCGVSRLRISTAESVGSRSSQAWIWSRTPSSINGRWGMGLRRR